MTGVAVWLTVRSAAEAIAFYQAAFEAVVVDRLDDDEGSPVVAQLSIAGDDVWVSADPDVTDAALAAGAIRMIFSVDDPDFVHARALAAGATQVAPVGEAYGWRIGRVTDPCGHDWEIGRRLDP
jgi:PhnB protein